MVKQIILTIMGKLASWIIWTLVINTLISLSIFTLFRVTSNYEAELIHDLTKIYPSLFLIILIPTALTSVTFHVMPIINYVPIPNKVGDFTTNLEKRLRVMPLDKRRSISIFLKRLGFSFLIIFIIFIILWGHERYFGGTLDITTQFVLQTLYILPAMTGTILIILSRFIMDKFDWAIFHLQNYITFRCCNDLEKSLASYNQILGSTLSPKRVLEVSQCINEVNKIGKKSQWDKISKSLNMILKSLKEKSLNKTNEYLIEASKLSNEIILEHRKTFDFQVKYPIRLQIIDFFRINSSKVLTQFVLFIIWIILVMLVISAGWVPNPPPF